MTPLLNAATPASAVDGASDHNAEIRIQEFRVSFIASETNVPLLGANARLENQATYEGLFETARTQRTPPFEFRAPWTATGRKSFWGRYLEGTPSSVEGFAAWKKLVPLRCVLPLNTTASIPQWNVSLAGYLYPFGQTLVVSVTVALPGTGVSIKDLADMAVAIRKNNYIVKTQPSENVEPITLSRLVDHALEVLRQVATGNSNAHGGTAGDLFSVLTILHGTGVALPEPVPDPPVDAAILPMLWALASGSDTYERDQVAPSDFVSIPLKKASPESHALFGSKHGRVVWFPVRFMDEPNERTLHPLGVYHRNLADCSAQVESLCGFLSSAGRLALQNRSLQPATFPLLRLAVGALNRLYKGSDTYMTRSVMNQITQRHRFVDEFNAIRAAINWKDGPFVP